MCKDTLHYREIWDLLKKDGLMKIVTYIGPCYEKLVQEFIINLSSESNKEESKEVCKVYVIGCCVNLSSEVINNYLGKIKSAEFDNVPSLDKMAREIIDNQVHQWPKKSLLS